MGDELVEMIQYPRNNQNLFKGSEAFPVRRASGLITYKTACPVNNCSLRLATLKR